MPQLTMVRSVVAAELELALRNVRQARYTADSDARLESLCSDLFDIEAWLEGVAAHLRLGTKPNPRPR